MLGHISCLAVTENGGMASQTELIGERITKYLSKRTIQGIADLSPSSFILALELGINLEILLKCWRLYTGY